MNAKANEISLPSEIKRGRLDLTERREKIGLTSPMTAREKKYIETGLKVAIEEAVGGRALLQAHEASLKETLKEIKTSRQKLGTTSKNEVTAMPLEDGNATA